MAIPEAKRRILIAIVIVLTALIVVIAAKKISKRRRARDPDRYIVGNPAAPRQAEAAKDLSIHLKSLVDLSRTFEDKVSQMGAEEKSLLPGGGALGGIVKSIAAPMNATREGLDKASPTYANLLAYYRGLAGSDQKMLSTATALENAGHSIHQRLDREERAAPLSDVEYSVTGDAGELLIEFARQIRGLLISVHRLGAALDVE
jgi:hypothetical protein